MSRQLGSRYVLDDVIGRGATGQVWRGHDVDGGPFAFKVLKDSIADDPDMVGRFVQERRILLSLDHPNLVRVHDMVVEGDTLALVMELVTGGDLRNRLEAEGSLTSGEACDAAASIADGMAAMHAAGIIHRDIKPENVLIGGSADAPVPKITDFGISRMLSTARQSTMMAGTPSYVAPELFDDLPPTVQTDLYSLGIVLYELVAGVPPFRSQSLLSIMKMHATQPPSRPDNIPDDLWAIIDRLLAKTPEARFGTAGDVAMHLRSLKRAGTSAWASSNPVAYTLPVAVEGADDIAAAEKTMKVRKAKPLPPAATGSPRQMTPGKPNRPAKKKRLDPRILIVGGVAIAAVAALYFGINADLHRPSTSETTRPQASTTASAATSTPPPVCLDGSNPRHKKGCADLTSEDVMFEATGVPRDNCKPDSEYSWNAPGQSFACEIGGEEVRVARYRNTDSKESRLDEYGDCDPLAGGWELCGPNPGNGRYVRTYASDDLLFYVSSHDRKTLTGLHAVPVQELRFGRRR